MLLGNMLGDATTLQNEVRKHAALLESVFRRAEQHVANPLINAPESYFDATPTFKRLLWSRNVHLLNLSSVVLGISFDLWMLLKTLGVSVWTFVLASNYLKPPCGLGSEVAIELRNRGGWYWLKCYKNDSSASCLSFNGL